MDLTERQRTIASVVRVYLAAHNQTHAELADALCMSRPAISQKLAGKIKWTLADLERLADYYHTDVESFVSGDVLRQLGVVVGRAAARTLAVSGPSARSA